MIKNGERKLAYITVIDEIKPIPNADKIELARVGGWQVVVSKEDHYKVGDKVIYIEIDSRVPSDKECFAFLKDRKYKVKSIKLRGQVSQGLIMPLSILPNKEYELYDDVTDILGIKKIENDFKQPLESKEMRLRGAHPKLYRKPWFKKMMHYAWFRKIAFKIFIPKKKKSEWPAWIVKTDEERIQNMLWVLENKAPMIVTEKLDGTSSTYSIHKEKGKWKFYVCSRNVVQDTPDKKCYYEDLGNVYWEMAYKYNIEKLLKVLADKYEAKEYVTLQGETIGDGIQKNKYKLEGRDIYFFNLIIDGNKIDSVEAAAALKEIHNEGFDSPIFKWVPIIETNYKLPDNFEELMEYSTGKSVLRDTLREGYVFRNYDENLSFKCVSNDFLLKWKE